VYYYWALGLFVFLLFISVTCLFLSPLPARGMEAKYTGGVAFFLMLVFLASAHFHSFDLRRIHSSRCYAAREKSVIGGLFGYGVFFYVWEGMIGGSEGVSFGIENSGHFCFFIFHFLSV